MKKQILYVPDGDYSLNGINVEVRNNNIFIVSDLHLQYGQIDSVDKQADGSWRIGYVRLGRIRDQRLVTKRDVGLLTACD